MESLKGHLNEGDTSVGTNVNISHIAATPLGMKNSQFLPNLKIDLQN